MVGRVTFPVVISFVLGETVPPARKTAALRWLPLYVAISGVALLMLVFEATLAPRDIFLPDLAHSSRALRPDPRLDQPKV